MIFAETWYKIHKNEFLAIIKAFKNGNIIKIIANKMC